ncbi:MAG: diacylglycerol kinase family protein [Candidatus Woesearchaeota archaeon]
MSSRYSLLERSVMDLNSEYGLSLDDFSFRINDYLFDGSYDLPSGLRRFSHEGCLSDVLRNCMILAKPQVVEHKKKYYRSNSPIYVESKSIEHAKDLAKIAAENGAECIGVLAGDGMFTEIMSSVYSSENNACAVAPGKGNSGNGARTTFNKKSSYKSDLEVIYSAVLDKHGLSPTEKKSYDGKIVGSNLMKIVFDDDPDDFVYSQFFGIGLTGSVIRNRENINEAVDGSRYIDKQIKKILNMRGSQLIKYGLATSLSVLDYDCSFSAEIESGDKINIHKSVIPRCSEITIGVRGSPGYDMTLIPDVSFSGDSFKGLLAQIPRYFVPLKMLSILKGKDKIKGIERFSGEHLKIILPEKTLPAHHDGEIVDLSGKKSIDLYLIKNAVPVAASSLNVY